MIVQELPLMDIYDFAISHGAKILLSFLPGTMPIHILYTDEEGNEIAGKSWDTANGTGPNPSARMIHVLAWQSDAHARKYPADDLTPICHTLRRLGVLPGAYKVFDEFQDIPPGIPREFYRVNFLLEDASTSGFAILAL